MAQWSLAQESMTLQQCIELAFQNNLHVKQKELALESNAASLKQAEANRLPSVNGFATHNYNWGQRIDPFTNQFANARVQSNSFGISSSVSLFSGFSNEQFINSQEALLTSSEYDLESQKNIIALNVASAFLDVLLTEELIVSAEQQVSITSAQLLRVNKLVAAGSLSLGDQYDMEAQLGRDRATFTSRQNDYYLAQLRLKQMMLYPADQPLSLTKPEQLNADTNVVLENSNTVYTFAETNRPEIKRAQYSLLSWDSQLKSAKGSYYPSLSLSGSIGSGYSGLSTEVKSLSLTGQEAIGFTEAGETVFQPTYTADLAKVGFGNQVSDNFNQFLGLSLAVPIFNQRSIQTSVAQAKINKEMAEIQVEQEKQTLRQAIESARYAALAAQTLYQSNIATLESTQKAFDFAKIRFEAGAMNATDFNNSKNNLQIAQAQLALSKYDFVFKTQVLDFYMGKPFGF